jgi:ribonuclease J
MIKITCYGGVKQIGGNKILLEDGRTKLFFDFGTSFGERDQYFEEYLRPRPGAGLLDMLELGLLPPLNGVFRDDFVGKAGLWERYKDSPLYREIENIDGVLLSHAHIDHSGYISFLPTTTPIYSTQMAAFIAKAMQDSGAPDFEKEVCFANPRVWADDNRDRAYLSPKGDYIQRPFAFADTPEISGAARQFWNQSANRLGLSEEQLKRGRRKSLELASFTPSPDRVGELKARLFPVDHSIHGAASWAVETSVGWVAYTGDLRWHGTRGDDTRRALEEIARLKPRVLLCEGTRAGGSIHRQAASYTETDVGERALTHVRAESGLVVADFGPRNVERLICFLEIAEQTQRRLVILPKDAYLLDAMRLASPKIPSVASSPNLFIYKDLKSQPGAWEQNLRYNLYSDRFVGAEEIGRSPGEYILCFSFWDVKNLIDVQPRGGLYVFSSSEAYTEEQEIDLRRLKHWLDHFEMSVVGLPMDEKGNRISVDELPDDEQGLHASGHASGPDLLDMIKQMEPKTMVTIHTEKPEYFIEGLAGTGIEIIEPEYGRPIELR